LSALASLSLPPEASGHSVEVTAESLFEAGLLAVSAFRKAGWVEETPGLGSRLEIEVREPAVKHTVTLAQLQRWVNGATRSPGGATTTGADAAATSELEMTKTHVIAQQQFRS
jgi:hypothetical protein